MQTYIGMQYHKKIINGKKQEGWSPTKNIYRTLFNYCSSFFVRMNHQSKYTSILNLLHVLWHDAGVFFFLFNLELLFDMVKSNYNFRQLFDHQVVLKHFGFHQLPLLQLPLGFPDLSMTLVLQIRQKYQVIASSSGRIYQNNLTILPPTK